MTRKTQHEIFIHAILVLLVIVLAFPVFFALVPVSAKTYTGRPIYEQS